MARVHRAGAEIHRQYHMNIDRQQDAEALEAMALECDAIAYEREHPATPQIACRDCKRLRPGPGFLLRAGHTARRICNECAARREQPLRSIIDGRPLCSSG